MIDVLLALALGAHGQLEEQIELLDRLIRTSPDNPRHRLRRGELYRFHGEEHIANAEVAARDWEAAEADFAKALELDPAFRAVHLARGRMRLAAGRPGEALASLEEFLRGDPGHGEGALYQARALAGLGRREEAVAAYTRSIERAAAPAPDLYLERAALQEELGRREEALRGLDEGLARLGGPVVFDLRALEIERALGRDAAALARIERRLARPGRAEDWQLRRAEILARLGRREEARAACEAALASIAALPVSRRNTPATQEVERMSRDLLSRIR